MAASIMYGPLGMMILIVGLISAVAAVVFRHRVARAMKAEEEALAEAGVSSYLGFHLQRVNGLLADDSHRKRLMDAVDAAVQMRHNIDSLDTLSEAPSISCDQATDLAQILVQRLSQLRSVGASETRLPLILDEPFSDLDPSMKPLLLELLSTTAGNPQVIFLTEDEEVASWARLEALTGEVSIIEPRPEHEERRLIVA